MWRRFCFIRAELAVWLGRPSLVSNHNRMRLGVRLAAHRVIRSGSAC